MRSDCIHTGNDAYGEYLLAKYGMIRSIVMNDEHEDFNDALVLMKDSANKGCLEAKEFLNLCQET